MVVAVMPEIEGLCDRALPDKRALFRHYMDGVAALVVVVMVVAVMPEIEGLCDRALPDKRALFRHYMWPW